MIQPGHAVQVDRFGNLLLTSTGMTFEGDGMTTGPASIGSRVDPITLQIVEGTLASIEAEVEAAIERTSRSPMIRDQHDFRAGLHDRHARKLTGRSYSAMVNPIVRDFPLETMREGDVYFHNDVYLSEGSIGHLPDLCSTVPVLFEGEVVAFVQAFGHHDDIGGAVPGSMPAHATSIFQEGLMIPPIKLYDAGRLNTEAYKIIFRNTRLPHGLQGDIDGEIAACRMGARRMIELFERYGRETVEACFEAILEKCAETYRREILPKIPDGTYVWEDYVEHDGVDPPKLYQIRMSMTKTPDKITLDLRGTHPQTKGPINWPGNYCEGRFPQEVDRGRAAQSGRHSGTGGRDGRERRASATCSISSSRMSRRSSARCSRLPPMLVRSPSCA